MSTQKKRENGYYFVRFKSEIKWRICLYEDGRWYWFGDGHSWTDDNHPFTAVYEGGRIEHPEDKVLN